MSKKPDAPPPPLTDIIQSLIRGEIKSPFPLTGGLRLRFKQATTEHPNRLLCYRNGRRPSVTEMRVMVRELGAVLPAGVEIAQSDYWTWRNEKGVIYGCYTLSWLRPDEFVQVELFA